MEDRLSELPCGWVWAKLGEISDIGAGNPAPQGEEYFDNGSFPFVRVQDMGNLRDDVYLKDTNDHINSKAIINMKLFPKGSVLFTKSGMSILLNQRAILARDMYVVSHIGVSLPLGGIPSEWVFYWLKTIDFKNITHATTLPSLQLSKVHEIPIPISPLPEQHCIVAKIEELFTRLDAGVEALNKIKAQLKRYRQAVLKYAFEGKLTKEWREAHKGEIEPASALLERIKEQRKKEAKGKFKELPPFNTSELPELPEGWEWTRIGEVMEVVRGASPRPKGDPRYFGGNIPWIMISDISKEKGKYISKTKDTVTEAGKARSRYLKAGTLILSNSGTVCVPKILAVNGCIHDGFVAFPDLSDNLDILYCYHYFDYIRPKIIQENKQGVTQVNLNTDIVMNIEIRLPSHLEQQKIVEEIESRLSIADNMEKVAEQSLKQSERLRQSILKRAFEGKLVPQDPTDEPAEKLLERIKEEKAKREAENRSERKHRNKKLKQMELI